MTQRSTTILTVLLVPSLSLLVVSLLLWLGVLPSVEETSTSHKTLIDSPSLSELRIRKQDCSQGICYSHAKKAMTALHDYYNPLTGLLNTTSWWNTANALETTMDYAKLTGDDSYDRAIKNTFERYRYINFLNPWYYDDEGWWVLTWIKAYDATGEKRYLDMAKVVFDDMKQGWDSSCGGGVWWLKRREYKNAITNELFLTAAVRLHLRTPGDSGPGSYIDWAKREWNWFNQHKLINSSNLVNDGLDSRCKNNNGTIWTYNQGVIIGGLVDMYAATEDKSFLLQAQAIADATIRKLAPDGILQESCEPADCHRDSPHFKGIFMRNLAYLYQVAPQPSYRKFILDNANSIWENNRNHANQFGLVWDGPFDQADAARQSSAMDAINAALSIQLGQPPELPQPETRSRQH